MATQQSSRSNFLLSGRAWPLAALAFALLLAPVAVRAQDDSAPPDDPNASQQDPPSVVARLSVLNGNVSLQPASVNDFSPANLNYPLTTGDRLYTDNGAQAELETGQVAVRLGSLTDFTVTAMTDQLQQFGLAQGSVHVRTFALNPGTTLELDTPNAAITVIAPGDVRVDVYPNTDTTVVTLLSGQAQVNAQDFQQALQPGESVQLAGSNPVTAQDVQPARPDALDNFSASRDNAYQSAESAEGSYVNAETIGAEDLSNYGSWDNSSSDDGPVWYPSGVAADWQPYCYGHWAWIAPWGWTWVEQEPWGFAPFHYGRWGRFGNRWGWVPGPRVVHPIYSPALVVFVGGARFAVGGTGVAAWFPLGPREPYVPWYHSSALYTNRVNVANIYNRNTVEVRNIYNQRTTNVYVNNTVVNRVYVNRQVATVAVPQNEFAAGRSVSHAALHLPPQQLAQATVLPHPMVTPTREIVSSTPARAVPRQVQRPVLETRTDETRTLEGNHNQPVTITRPVSRPAQPTSVRPTAQPIGQPDGLPVRRSGEQYVAPQPVAPASGAVNQPNPERRIEQMPTSTRQPVAPQENPAEERQTFNRGGANFEEQRPAQPEERPLVNRAVPPSPNANFEQQRQAIESTDPGRPLGPRQMENVRQNRPAGEPQQHESVPHPQPAPRPAPPPPSRPSPPSGGGKK